MGLVHVRPLSRVAQVVAQSGADALPPPLSPPRDLAPEFEIARKWRYLSPSATPNKRLVERADALLSRQGRMVRATESIGRGADCFEGEVFGMETA
jgi:predicted protein tyrosine phosphatase